MYDDILRLKPRLLFDHFTHLLATPRGSGNEAGVRGFILDYADQEGLKSEVDKAGNVYVYVPPTKGCEGVPTLVLQGHLDMVCEKNESVEHNFEKDPIPAYVDGDWIRAHGTTLGADNGLGLAMAMSLAVDPKVTHGPLILFFTVDEETGLTGVFEMETKYLHGAKYLLNFDSEDGHVIYVGCAGGVNTELVYYPYSRRRVKFSRECRFRLSVSGLLGGHSGLDIDKGRGNAIKVMARVLDLFHQPAEQSLGIIYIEAGSKRNAIPRDALVYGVASRAHLEEVQAALPQLLQTIQQELGENGQDLVIKLEEKSTDRDEVWDTQSSRRFVELLLALPTGVTELSQDIPGMVQTSTNLAVVLLESVGKIFCSTRSALDSQRDELSQRIRLTAQAFRASVGEYGVYPGWKPADESLLRDMAVEVFTQAMQHEPEVTMVHAGLECGVIRDRMGGQMDCLSIGPKITGAHSPDEAASIPSTQQVYAAAQQILFNFTNRS